MKIYAISDLHLSFTQDKPMNIFGDHWLNHFKIIKQEWNRLVHSEDLVIVGGDISWAMRYDDAIVDIEWVNALPGFKVFAKGNHDYWWQSVQKMSLDFPNIHFLQNNYLYFDNKAICGTRGWLLPGSSELNEEDLKIFQRETLRLQRSLDMASKDPRVEEIIVVFHYPPVSKECLENDFVKLLKKYNVKHVSYGHLHDQESWSQAIEGEHDGIHYYLTACDYKNFTLTEIDPK